jgi:hypothetical protein
MRYLFGTILILLLVIVLVGLYEGWFNVSAQQGENTTNVNISVDRGKIREDTDRAKKGLEHVEEKIREHIHVKPAQNKQ